MGKAVVRGESSGSLGPVKAYQQEGLLAWLTLTTVSTYTEDCSVVLNLTLAEATSLQNGMTIVPLSLFFFFNH